MSEKQKTLGKEVSLSGIGLHTGRQVNLTMKPAKENTGFVFVRTDLEVQKILPKKKNNSIFLELNLDITKKCSSRPSIMMKKFSVLTQN